MLTRLGQVNHYYDRALYAAPNVDFLSRSARVKLRSIRCGLISELSRMTATAELFSK